MKAVEIGRIGILALALAGVSSCGSVVRDGSGTSFLIVETLAGNAGSGIRSDVTVRASDSATATLSVGLKDPGLGAGPTQNQLITVDRYRVRYTRADGRNTPGVDVPYGFDGALTATVGGMTTVTFTIVRQIAKDEAPLKALGVNGLVISTIADVTFYGRDQTGRDASVTAKTSIDFGNFSGAN